MSSYQAITIVGNVGRDPEMKFLQNGRAVCNFSVAVSKRWKDQQTNEQKEKTTWFKVACFGNLAETTHEYVRKGSKVLVVGDDVSAEAFIDNGGKAQAALKITARDVRFMSSANGGQNVQDDAREQSYSDVDDIPF
jgi:single-strand DNA-binding protein